MLGRPYVPTDVDNEFGLIQWLGYPVRAEWEGVEYVGTLANVETDGQATIERDGFCLAIIPHHAIRLNLSSEWLT